VTLRIRFTKLQESLTPSFRFFDRNDERRGKDKKSYKIRRVEMFVQIDNVKIFYETKGNGMPVIYVHGNFASSKWFEDVMKIDGMKTYALDLPNFGNSESINSISIESYAQYLWKFIESLKISRPLLVGHSLGGAVTLKCVIDHPNAFSGLILVDPAPADGLKTAENLYPILESFKDHPELLEFSLANTMPTRKEKAKALIEDALKMNQKAFSGNARALEEYDYSQNLKDIKIPVKILWGSLDPIVSRESLEKMAKMIPNCQFEVFDNIGHSVIVENPKKFIETLVNFKNALP
jgi:branched-chain amino acid transport system permease protein